MLHLPHFLLRGLLPALFVVSSATVVASQPSPDAPAQNGSVDLFPLADVRLTGGPFQHAQDLNRRYLLAHDIHRLLAPFRIEAGLIPKGPKYPNWESSGLDGHTAGHYLTALAQMWAATGDAEMKDRLDAMVRELAECQEAQKDGYVGGIPRGRVLWEAVAKGELDFQNFSLNGAWVPWYNEHKLFAGLRDAWLIGGNAQARDVLIRLADWCEALVAHLSDEQMQGMLRTEHGGMNEVLADVYAITGNSKYFKLAQRFSHRALLEPLLLHQDKLTGLHANTQIPKVIGYTRIAELGGDASWRDAAQFFWNTVVDHRSLAFGGNSEREHFNATDDFGALVESREGPETCNTYNMLRLSEALFRREPSARYADYYERALINHILSSQHPEHGGYVYFTSIRPRHYRVYSQPEVCFWCCVGSGMENHGKYGAFIYAHTEEDLYVNLFIPSKVEWPERGLSLRQDTHFPDTPSTRLTVTTGEPQQFVLRVRHPSWVAKGALAIRVNGKLQPVLSSPSSYVSIEREWRNGDQVEIELPMRTSVERLPDGSDYVALLHGPVVLAAKTGVEELDGLVAGDARMGHVTPGPYLPLDEAPMLVGDIKTIADEIRPVEGKPLTFSAASLIQPKESKQIELVPFFRVHDARYQMYWRTVSAEQYSEVAAALAASEQSRLELESRTLDQVIPGEQQPEVEHGLRSDGSQSGVTHGRRWRDATNWFSYKMQAASDGPMELLVTYNTDERGRKFDIVVNELVIASVDLNGGKTDQFVDVSYAIPADLLRTTEGGTLTIKFAAKEKSRTASIFGVRLLKARDPNAAP